MAPPKVQTLGITRWSYPGTPDGYRRSEDDLARLRARLYAPARLEHRLFLLEHVLLPGLKAQTDPDFTQLFVLGDQLPDPWRSRLQALLTTLPQASVAFVPEGQNMHEVVSDLVDQARDPKRDILAQHRIDDDDAVSTDFVAESRRIFSYLLPIFEDDGIAGLDYTRGFILETDAEGARFRPVSARQWAPGLVVYQESAQAKSLFAFPHLRVWHEMPTLTFRDRPMYIRGAHHDNDSHLDTFARRTKSFRFNPRNKRRYLQRRFGIDSATLHRVWLENYALFTGAAADADPRVAE